MRRRHVSFSSLSVLLGVALFAGCASPERPAADAAPVTIERSQTEKPQVAAPAVAPTNRTLTTLSVFLHTPPPTLARPESAAGNAIANAQSLYRNGATNAAIDLLQAAQANPACQTNRLVVTRKLITLLLLADRVPDAQAAYLASGTAGEFDPFNGTIISRHLLFEKGDAPAAVEWAARLEALPLRDGAAEANRASQLTALTLAGRQDEAQIRLKVLLARTNRLENARLVRAVAGSLIQHDRIEPATRFLDTVAAAGGEAHSNQVANLRQLIENRRANPAVDGAED